MANQQPKTKANRVQKSSLVTRLDLIVGKIVGKSTGEFKLMRKVDAKRVSACQNTHKRTH